MDSFENLMVDLLGDAGIYMEKAAKQVEKDCLKCKGTGEAPLPVNDREMAMQMLSALARDMGGSSTVPVAGDSCQICNGTGKICDDDAILIVAAMAAAKDYRDDMRAVLKVE